MEYKLYPFKLYIRRKPIFIMMFLAILAQAAIWFWLLVNIRPELGQVFLHYNVLFGVDLVGEWYQALYVPLIGLCIFIVNTILGWMLYTKDPFASYLLHAVALACEFLLLVAAILIVFLNV